MVNSQLYENIAEKYAEVVDTKPFHTMYERPNFLDIFPSTKTINGKTILDLGCGGGWYAEQFTNANARVIAVDSSEAMLKIAQTRLNNNKLIEYHCHDLNFPMSFLDNNSIDHIAAPLVIHYIKDWNIFFAEAYRVIRANGKFCFSTHHPYGDIELYQLKDYFATQIIKDTWKDIGDVEFYHHSLHNLFEAIYNAGFKLEIFKEPSPLIVLKDQDPLLFERLSTKPALLFIRLVK